jgi:hypothetical protein
MGVDYTGLFAANCQMKSPRLYKYKYQALRRSDSIRLLKLDQPPSTSIFNPGLIRCSMEEVPLSGAPPYHALSYTWKEDEVMVDWARKGRQIFNPITRLHNSKWWKAFVGGGGIGSSGGVDVAPSRSSRFPRVENAVADLAAATVAADADPDMGGNLSSRLIICDGRAILVTKNLHNALNAVAQLYPGYWWIDQLCINQDDLQERSAQVALMGQLYRNAFQVVVWLGERTQLEARAVAALDMMATVSDDVEDIVTIAASVFSGEMPKLVGMVSFFSRSWFDRLWIV